jgi:hypothetical protein
MQIRVTVKHVDNKLTIVANRVLLGTEFANQHDSIDTTTGIPIKQRLEIPSLAAVDYFTVGSSLP